MNGSDGVTRIATGMTGFQDTTCMEIGEGKAGVPTEESLAAKEWFRAADLDVDGIAS